MAILRYLDVVLVAVAAVPAIALGAPAFGYLVGAAGWILTRVIQSGDRRWLRKVSDPTRRLGFSFFEAFGRIWLLAGAIVIAGTVGGRADGLTAAIVIFAAYSIAFATKLIGGPPPQREPS
jgi:hypothetical protein